MAHDDKGNPVAKCPHCGKYTAADEHTCQKCGKVINPNLG